MKHLVTIFFATLLAGQALAYDFQSGDLYYNITSSTAPYTVEVSGHIDNITMADIPETITDNGITYAVTSIGSNAFCDCAYMTSITIPESVTKIEGYAFWNCHNIIPLTIPNTVSEIGQGAFGRVKNVIYNGAATGSPWDALNINGVPDENGFLYGDSGKTQLTAYVGNGGDVVIPNTVTDIGSQSFGRCVGLISVVIGNNVTNIGDEAFNYCNNLTTVSIANSVTSINRGVFVGSDNLQFNEYDNALYLGNAENQYLFLYRAKNTDIASCEINNNCKLVCDYAFSDCKNLSSVIIPESVIKIENYVFYNCPNLLSISIPASIIQIEGCAFEGIKNIIYTGSATGSPWRALNVNGIVDGDFIYADAQKTQLTAYIGNGGDVVIPNTVTSIRDRAFNGCTTLLSVTIPTTIESVGEGVFDGCNNLQYKEYDSAKYLGNAENPYLCLVKATNNDITKCKINNNCKIICGVAFGWCDDLTMINIPNTVTYIGNYAFGWCSNIVVTIPESVIGIEGAGFFCDGATLYCQAASKPDGWSDGWNWSNDVVWSCKVVNVNVNNAKFGNVSTAGNYTIKADDGSLWYLNGTANKSITLSATANEGCHFVGWNDGDTRATRTIAVTESNNYTAEFAINTYTVSTSAENGLVVGAGAYTHGKQATLIATPSIGYQFLCWNDTVTANPRILTVTSDSSFTAVFEPKIVTDTIKIEVIKTDTIYLMKTDTLIYYKDVKFVHDTIEKEVVVHDTVIYYKDVKFVHDTVVNTILDTVINTIHDIVENKIFIHDTIYITKTDTIYLQTSVSDAQAIGLSIYPNPTASFVTVTGEGVFWYVLTNTNGKVLRKEEDATSYVVDLSEYADGIYLLHTSDGVTHKIVKQ